MKFTLFRFHFNEPLHISSVREDYARSESYIGSDTLYAAVSQVLRLTEDNSGFTVSEPGFSLSSMFPFWMEKNKEDLIYFLPKPIGTLTAKTYKDNKKYKRIRYLEKDLFDDLVQGKDIMSAVKPSEFISRKNIAMEGLMSRQVSLRNRTPRNTQTMDSQGIIHKADTEPYYIERIYFRKKCGLYCLFSGNEGSKKSVLKAFKMLQYEGIGTDRSTGNGRFDLDYEEVDWFEYPSSVKYNKMVGLSLFLPEDKNQLVAMLGEDAKYELITRGGWITNVPFNTLRKKSITMFREGSVFNLLQNANLSGVGKTVNVKPDTDVLPLSLQEVHNVYRSGRCIFVPMVLHN